MLCVFSDSARPASMRFGRTNHSNGHKINHSWVGKMRRTWDGVRVETGLRDRLRPPASAMVTRTHPPGHAYLEIGIPMARV